VAILRAKNGAAAPVRSVLNTMLPVFVGWTLVVVLVIPALYGRYDHAAKEAFTKEHPRRSYSSLPAATESDDEVEPAVATESDEE